MISALKTQVKKILDMKDSAHSIAWGIAIGTFIGWTPTLGIQMIIAGLVAWALGGNKPAALIAAWISNPYTAIPIYWLDYIVGCTLMGQTDIDQSAFLELFASPYEGADWMAYTKSVYERIASIAAPLWLGALALGSACGALFYGVAFKLIVSYRARSVPSPGP